MSDETASIFREAIGADRVDLVTEPGSLADHHRRPAVVLTPKTGEEVHRAVAASFANKIPLLTIGGDTQPGPALEGATPGALLSTLGLDETVDHQVGDLVVTFGAGMTLDAAQRIVGAHGQQLPLSAPYPDRATLGGIVASAAEGPTLSRFGPVRDQVLEVRIVHGDGRMTRAGGKVVKNVTGYDLLRLYTGSRGSLGVLTELTLRLRPLEQAARVLILRFEDSLAAFAAAWQIRQAVPAVFALHVIAGASLQSLSEGSGSAALVVSLRGASALVDRLVTECCACVEGLAATSDEAATELALLQTPFPVKWIRTVIAVNPSEGGELLGEAARRFGEQAGMVHDVQTGHLHLGVSGTPESALGQQDLAGQLWGGKRESAPCPTTSRLTRELKLALDPAGILNPGCFEVAG